MTKKQRITKSIMQKFFVIIGGFIAAYGLEAVLIPNSVSDGGITGISIVLSQLTPVPLGVLIALLNIPFVYLGYKQIGKTFAINSVIGIAALSIGTMLIHHVPTIVSGDALLITVVGGILLGFGMGISLRNGGALDGLDMIAVLLSRKLPFSTSDMILFLNFFVFIIVATVFGFKGALLSAIAYFIASKVITIVEEGFSGSKTFKIITNEPIQMVEAIRNRLGRSATFNVVQGAYSNQEFQEITCVINRLEDSKMKAIIREVDPNAFITVYEVVEVKGGSFKKQDIH